jgi:hypothetical protein
MTSEINIINHNLIGMLYQSCREAVKLGKGGNSFV